MDKPTFVYVTYITTTPQKLWDHLTNGDFTVKYWVGMRWECDWKVGSRFKVTTPNGTPGITGEILEFTPPKRLVYTFAAPQVPDEVASRVTYDIEPLGREVKLTVTHDGFPVDSKVFSSIQNGWPKVLSSLKTLLETGVSLDIADKKHACGGPEAPQEAVAGKAH